MFNSINHLVNNNMGVMYEELVEHERKDLGSGSCSRLIWTWMEGEMGAPQKMAALRLCAPKLLLTVITCVWGLFPPEAGSRFNNLHRIYWTLCMHRKQRRYEKKKHPTQSRQKLTTKTGGGLNKSRRAASAPSRCSDSEHGALRVFNTRRLLLRYYLVMLS